MVTLAEILRSAADDDLDGWLFLPANIDWTVATPALMIDLEAIDESDFVDNLPPLAREKSLVETLDGATLNGVYHSADLHESPPSDATLLEAFLYYFRFDAWLPSIGAPDPPPPEESRRQYELEFYNSLGDERENVPCKRDGCDRGAVTLSVFCRVHHFENVRTSPCPFSH